MNPSFRRRDLLQASVLAAVGAGYAASPLRAAAAQPASDSTDPWRGLKIGVATYSLRTLPAEAAIAAIRRMGIKYVSVKDSHLSMKTTRDERKVLVQKFLDAGITPLSCGNIGMANTEASVRAAFEYARDIGVPTIVCTPDPASMPLLDKMVKEFDIRIAIHNHGPEDKRFPSPYNAYQAVERWDKRMGLCVDVGHTQRAGVNPAEAIVKCRDRVFDIHLKDNATRLPRAAAVEVGRGALDIPAILQALISINFPYHIGFEYEKDSKDPVPGLSESVGYVRGVLRSLPPVKKMG